MDSKYSVEFTRHRDRYVWEVVTIELDHKRFANSLRELADAIERLGFEEAEKAISAQLADEVKNNVEKAMKGVTL
jgi:hypothetical protein